ncbi:MAG: nitrogenase component 1 [Clostridiales bacterium]
MAVLSLFLPPFSPDYSGVSAVLFDLKTVTAMHDASGCTGNYTGYDEPRWYGSKSPVYCSGLREIDAVLGDDEKLIQKMIDAARDIQPDLMALVGSPVPMVIGSDLTGVAAELEERTGIPSFGFDTTGTAYYDKGAAATIMALLKRFTKPLATEAGSVNILGATPMDFGKGENLRDLKKLLQDRGLFLTACLAMDYNLAALRQSAAAEVNLAVSRTGLLVAAEMEKRYGIPYLCGLPYGEKASEEYFAALEEVRQSRQSRILNLSSCEAGAASGTDPLAAAPEILIVGEQVQANAIRLALQRDYGESSVAVGCLFGLEPGLALPQDKDLKSEQLIGQELNRDNYRLIIADPFLKVLLQNNNKEFWPNAQYAVSSKLAAEQTARLTGSFFNRWINLRVDENQGLNLNRQKEGC